MNKPKENAMQDFVEHVRHSWPYDRMTAGEKYLCEKALTSACAHDIQGNYNQRWMAYNAIFYGYLLGIGYNGALWREPDPESVPFVPGGAEL